MLATFLWRALLVAPYHSTWIGRTLPRKDWLSCPTQRHIETKWRGKPRARADLSGLREVLLQYLLPPCTELESQPMVTNSLTAVRAIITHGLWGTQAQVLPCCSQDGWECSRMPNGSLSTVNGGESEPVWITWYQPTKEKRQSWTAPAESSKLRSTPRYSQYLSQATHQLVKLK